LKILRDKKSDFKTKFEEKCFLTKTQRSEVKEYNNCLKERIQDIEQVIDSHFELIKPTIKKDVVDRILKKFN
jgi:actin-like ATPase involved in cell morphogenesis